MNIWKYPINVIRRFAHSMPRGARIVHVAAQHGEPQMWVEVPEPKGLVPGDERRPTEAREFFVVGTGHPFDSSYATYRGTFFLEQCALVFHLYEVVS